MSNIRVRSQTVKMLKSIIHVIIIALSTTTLNASPYTFENSREISTVLSSMGLFLIGSRAEQSKTALTSDKLSQLDDDNIPYFDRPYAGQWDPRAAQQSNTALYGSLALPIFFAIHKKDDALPTLLLYLEISLLEASLVEASKGLVTRYRPYVYGDKAPLQTKLTRTSGRSFFSGHAAAISAGLVTTAKLFSDYYSQSPWLPVIWSGATLGSLTLSWLRVKAGKHFPSDVIIGSMVGGVTAYGVLQSHKKESKLSFDIKFDHLQGYILELNYVI